MFSTRFCAIVAAAGLACAAVPASDAAVVSVPATQQGIISPFGQNNAAHNSGLGNIQIGLNPSQGGEYRCEFVFDLSGISGVVTGATLRLAQPFNGYISPDPTETMTIRGLSSSYAPVLLAETTPFSGRTDIYNAIAAGATYGSFDAPASLGVYQGQNANPFAITLDTAAFASAATAALGGNFAMGGLITSISGPARQTILGFSSYSERAVLELTVEVPSPGVAPAVIAGMGLMLRRRHRPA